MSKIQFNELNKNTSELEVLNREETAEVVGGGDVNNNQFNGSTTIQNSSYGGVNASFTHQNNFASISNVDNDYQSYGGYWYY